MKIVNENASCYTCKYCCDAQAFPPAERCRACKKCATKNGYLGWQPAPGVKAGETQGWTFTGAGKPVETIFRKFYRANDTDKEIEPALLS